MNRGLTSALALGALALVAATSAQAEEPTAAAPSADNASTSEAAGPRRPVSLGLSPISPPTPPAPGAAPSFGSNTDSNEAAFHLGGTIFGSETVGIGTLGQAKEPGQSGTPLHVPARYQGRLPLYVGVNAGILVTYGTPVVSATVTMYAHASGKEWEGYYAPVRGPAFSQAYLTVAPPPLGGGKLRLQARVGAFSEFFGGPGQWGWGIFGPLLATRGYGESITGEYDLSSETRLTFGQGVAGIPSVPEAFVRGTYTGWNETGVSTVFQHDHIGINYQGKYIAKLHLATVFGADERRYLGTAVVDTSGNTIPATDIAHDGKMNILIAEGHWFTDHLGQIGVSAAYWDLNHATSIQDGVWWGLNFTQGAQDLTRNYLGPYSRGTGKVAAISAEYDLSLARVLWYPQPFDGNGPDLRMIFAGVADRTLATDEPDFRHATAYLFGAELDYRMFRWFSTTLRTYGEDRHLINGQWRVVSVTPGIAFRSDWQSVDHIELLYSRLFYGSAVDNNPAAPLDRSVITLAAGMDF